MYITINSEFKPFTYDELTKPLRDYTEAYNKVEEQYATLAQQTEAWKNIATQENSPEAYAMYRKYSDELNAVVEDFSRGMTIQNRSRLSGLKSRYASEITPIATAYTALSNANAFRDEMRAQDDSIIFNVDRYTSLDDFLNGQMVDNSFISGRTLQADIANQVLADGYNRYNELVEAGHSKQAAARIIAEGNWIDEDSMLSGIYDNAGITTEDAAAKIRNYTDNGIAQGMTALSSNIESILLQEQAARAERYSGEGGGGGTRNPRQASFNLDDTLVRLYDTFGYKGSYNAPDKEVTTQYMNDGEWSNYSRTITSGEKVYYTNEQKLSMARNNPDIVEAARLIQEGLDEETVVDYYIMYRNNDNNIETFEDYMNYVADYELYRDNEGPDSFNDFVARSQAEE